MNTGVPPPPLKARTGEFTPPGIKDSAREKTAVHSVIVFFLSYKNNGIVLKNRLFVKNIFIGKFPLCYPLQKNFRIKLC